jgi:hypothetical protein
MKEGNARMLRLTLSLAKTTPSAQRVKERAKEVGSGIPDIVAPSAYREVEPSRELLDAARDIYKEMERGRQHLQTGNGNGNGNGDSDGAGTLDRDAAAKIADDENRQLLELSI